MTSVIIHGRYVSDSSAPSTFTLYFVVRRPPSITISTSGSWGHQNYHAGWVGGRYPRISPRSWRGPTNLPLYPNARKGNVGRGLSPEGRNRARSGLPTGALAFVRRTGRRTSDRGRGSRVNSASLPRNAFTARASVNPGASNTAPARGSRHVSAATLRQGREEVSVACRDYDRGESVMLRSPSLRGVKVGSSARAVHKACSPQHLRPWSNRRLTSPANHRIIDHQKPISCGL